MCWCSVESASSGWTDVILLLLLEPPLSSLAQIYRVPYSIIGIMHYANYALYHANYIRGVFSMDNMHNVHNVVMSPKAWANRPILVPIALKSVCRPLRRALRPEDLRLYGAGV